MTQTDTPWAAGRMRGAGDARLLFGTMYEDAAIEDEAFTDRSSVFAIAAAGDTALRLAGTDRHVTAVDVNGAQVEYVRDRLQGAPRIRVMSPPGGVPAGPAPSRNRALTCAFAVPRGWLVPPHPGSSRVTRHLAVT